MGIAWLLLKRTFASRPKRTLLFLLGYALATAVMITLLAVGEAVLLQAQDKDILGGGDLILVPQGIDIESLKVGGVGAMYYTIPQGRFIVRQALGSSRFGNSIDTVSPYLFSQLLYVRKAANPALQRTVYAEGSLPDQERLVRNMDLPWKNNSEDLDWISPGAENFYHNIDHFHLPVSEKLDLSRWAEWHYFNFEAKKFYGYLSIMAAGDVFHGKGNWIVSLQLFDGGAHRYAAVLPASRDQLPLERVDYRTSACSVRFVKDHYEISVGFKDRKPVRGTVRFTPQPNLYFPPAYLAMTDTFESGYVIPSLRGGYQGSISVGSHTFDFSEASGYHDHNWGIWQQPQSAGQPGAPVSWNWGHAYADNYSLFYGEIFLRGKSKGLFLGVFDNRGFVTMFRPGRIEYSDPETLSQGIRVPTTLKIAQSKAFTEIEMIGRKKSLVATPQNLNHSFYFIQYKMDFDIHLAIDGKDVRFPAHGNAETFVSRNP